MNYRWQAQRMIYARYGIIYQDFDDEFRTESNNYVVHQPTLGLNLDLGPHSAFAIEFGYWRRDTNNEGKENGFVLNSNFNTQGEKASFSLLTNSGYELDYGSSDNRGFSKYSDSSVNVDYQLTEDSRFFATARYRWQNYTDIDKTDHTYGGRVGFASTFLRWLTVSLEGGHLERESNDSTREFTNNRVILRLTTAYPIPFWD
jgi:hypothetical protein